MLSGDDTGRRGGGDSPHGPTFRKLLPHEYGAYRRHLLRLSASDRVARFHAGMADEAIVRHCERLSWPDARLIGYFADDDLRGAVELQSFKPATTPVGAELAVSVEGPYQGRGVGMQLVRRALVVARTRRIRCVAMTSLPNNARMLEIGRRLDGLSCRDDDSVFTRYMVDRPDPRSMTEELADDGVALVFAGLDRWQRNLAAWVRRPGAGACG